ncbi:MAG: TIGR01212 family radical SAM protein [Bacteroidetes bacterium]|nr:TIGR01212 family radical SAM protein [Bacteroidota bacterium]
MDSFDFPWGPHRYNSYTWKMKTLFGERLQKLAIDAGFTCPNRDGTAGTGGCTYCVNEAFNPSYCVKTYSITEQIRLGIEFHAVRYRRAGKFLAYFQPYSNTYAPLDVLKERYQEALSYPGVAGLVIGTRPDCIDDDILQYLASLQKDYFIQVEYGIESVYEKTLERINRRHTFVQGIEAIMKTKALGISTGAHFIFGLPGETPGMMRQYASVISGLPLDSVKFHQLQVIKGTVMEKEFSEKPGDFHVFSLQSYIDFIIDFLEELNPEISIERFAGEVPPRYIEDRNWGLLRYDEVLRRIEKELEKRKTWQGKQIAKQRNI